MEFTLVDSSLETVISGQQLTLNTTRREVSYDGFQQLGDNIFYWKLPSEFLGNKARTINKNFYVYLRFCLSISVILLWRIFGVHTQVCPQSWRGGAIRRRGTGGALCMFTNLESQYLYSCVQGNDVMFVHFSEPLETGPSGHKYRVLMHESAWERLDRPGSPASREYIMMALAGLDNILIKAAFSERTSTAGISDVSLDTGSERDPRSGRGRASAVEQCQCPPGYKGLSCEACAPGYRRSGLGLYLGHCQPCDCNGKSSSCDSETGKCLVKACRN